MVAAVVVLLLLAEVVVVVVVYRHDPPLSNAFTNSTSKANIREIPGADAIPSPLPSAIPPLPSAAVGEGGRGTAPLVTVVSDFFAMSFWGCETVGGWEEGCFDREYE